MFIHFNSMAAVLLKCSCAACINPLRQGRDRLGEGRRALLSLVSCCLSSIIICLSAFVCLLALSLSFSILPLILHHSCLFAPCSLLHLCNILLSVTPTFDLQCVYIYLCCWRVPVLSLCLSGAIYQNELSLCLSVCFFLCV